MRVHGVGAPLDPNHEGSAIIKYEYTMTLLSCFHCSRHALRFPTKGAGTAFDVKEIIAVNTALVSQTVVEQINPAERSM